MAAALLASPSLAYDNSPDSSFDSNSSTSSSTTSSPRLPALSSPFSLTQLSQGGDDNTPTRRRRPSPPSFTVPSTASTNSTATPGWVTDELEEEWVQSPTSSTEDDDSIDSATPRHRVSSINNNNNNTGSTSSDASSPTARAPNSAIRQTSSSTTSTSSLDRTKPRVPSSLRYAFTSSLSHSEPPTNEDGSFIVLHEDLSISDDGASGSAGTFIARSTPSNSYRVAGREGGGGGEDQLKAAVRALRGPAGGLGAGEEVVEDEGEGMVREKNGKGKEKDRLGLMKLFEPLEEVPQLPRSTIPAPTISSFTFSPPPSLSQQTPLTNKHSLPPSDSTESTPLARPSTTTTTNNFTPSRTLPTTAPAPKPSSRYLHRPSTSLHPSSSLPHDLQLIPDSPPLLPLSSTTPPTPPTTVVGGPPEPLTPGGGKLFTFNYDTFTRGHLAALVEEIDELSSPPPQHGGEREEEEENRAWERSFVSPVLPSAEVEFEEVEQREEEEEEEEGEPEGARSSKRIRLSPRLLSSTRTPLRSSTNAGGGAGGFRTALGASASRRSVGSRRSPTIFGGGGGRRVGRLNAATTTRVVGVGVGVGVEEGVRKTTREKLDEANRLMERIRAKKIGVAAGGEREREREKEESPRKLLRRFSASEEVEREFAVAEEEEEEEEEEKEEGERELVPGLVEKARASLREALEGSVVGMIGSPIQQGGITTSSTMGTTTLTESPRRHFARTPIGHGRRVSTSNSRLQLGELFPPLPLSTNLSSSSSPSLSSTTTTDQQQQPDKKKQQHNRHSSLTTIGPNDLEAIRLLSSHSHSTTIPSSSHPLSHSSPATGGLTNRMILDPVLRRWIKAPRPVSSSTPGVLLEEGEGEESTESEDPFRSFDVSTTTTSHSVVIGSGGTSMSRVEGLSGLGISAGTPVVSPVLLPSEEEKEKVEVQPSPEGACYFEEPPTEEDGEREVVVELEEEEEDTATWGRGEAEKKMEEEDGTKRFFLPSPSDEVTLPTTTTVERALRISPSPSRLISLSSSSTPITTNPPPPTPSRALAPTPPTTIPRSALKPTRSQSDPTPTRNVSFSDGKKSGKIVEGLVVLGSGLKFEVGRESEEEEGEFGSLEFDEGVGEEEDGEEGPDGSPLASFKRSHSQHAPPPSIHPNASNSPSSVILSTFDSAPPVRPRRPSTLSHQHSRTYARTTLPDATFLTECSFGVSIDRLVQLITDVEPFEPDWEGLKSLSLKGKEVESVVRLKELLPGLDEVDLSNNLISFLTGLPSSLRTLLLPTNRLSSLTSFAHLTNLERLDLSNNPSLTSLEQLNGLKHLRELKVEDCKVESLRGLEGLDGLTRVCLRGNLIAEMVEFGEMGWSRLESLNLSRNKIKEIEGLETLQNLTLLNLDHNLLTNLLPTTTMPSLRVLRLCSNPLPTIDIAFAPRLRTLFVDNAKLGSVTGTERLRKLENLSVRDQNGGALSLAMSHIRDVKRLYLSGNPIPTSFPSEKFFNLVYLELAMCQLDSLPTHLAQVIPNVRVLNLNFNALSELSPLEGLTRLKKLSVVGARVEKCRGLVRVVGSLKELESLDLRMNPLTLPFYPPFLPPTSSLLPSHTEHQILHPSSLSTSVSTSDLISWTLVDKKFRKQLPDEWYFKRASHRAVLLSVGKGLKELDGVECEKERPKLERVLRRLEEKGLDRE